jgi:hypothetical protein
MAAAATGSETAAIAQDLDVMDAAAMSELINACVHDDNDSTDNDDNDDNDDIADKDGGYQHVPEDFDPLAELDDDFDPLAECSDDEEPVSVASSEQTVVARAVPPPTPPKHTKPALIRSIVQQNCNTNDERDDVNNVDNGDQQEPDCSVVTEGTGGDLPLPRHLRTEGSATALTARALTPSTSPTPTVSRCASTDELQANRRVSAVDVSHLGKGLPLPKKLRKPSQPEVEVPTTSKPVRRAVPPTTIVEKPLPPTKPKMTLKVRAEPCQDYSPCLTHALQNDGVADYYGSHAALEAPAKPAKPLKPALIGRGKV